MSQQKCFRSANDWKDVQDALKIFSAKHCEAHERELLIASQQQQDNRTDVENDEEEGSFVDGDDDNRFSFARSNPVDAPAL